MHKVTSSGGRLANMQLLAKTQIFEGSEGPIEIENRKFDLKLVPMQHNLLDIKIRFEINANAR